MARPHRPLAAETMYHITANANADDALFRDDIDWLAVLDEIQRAVETYGVECHSYCLMTTHYHLLLRTTSEANLDECMWSINCRYAKAFTRRRRRKGHVFQRRYDSTLVLDDAHFIECLRYIALNPVRAGICSSPEQWPWSSFRAAAGYEAAPGFLTLEWTLAAFGPDPARARRRYADFVTAGVVRRAA